MIEELLNQLSDAQRLQLREAFNNEESLIIQIGDKWVGVHVPQDRVTTTRKGCFAAGDMT
jgi:hypothetical protein